MQLDSCYLAEVQREEESSRSILFFGFIEIKIILAWERKLNSFDQCHMLDFIIGFCVPT